MAAIAHAAPALLPFSGPRAVALRLEPTHAQSRELRRFLGRVNLAASAAARRGFAFNATSAHDLHYFCSDDLRRLRFGSRLCRDVLSAAIRHLKSGYGLPERLPPDAPFRLSAELYTVARGCVGVRTGTGWVHCPVANPCDLDGLVVAPGRRAELRADGDGFVLDVPTVPAARPVVRGRPVEPVAVDVARLTFHSDVLMS